MTRPESPVGVIFGFHGYAQAAEDMLAELEQVPGADRWVCASIQALHPFYTRGHSKVVASWMTRQDRDLAIADNIAYVTSVMSQIRQDLPEGHRAIAIGFSQGTAMAYRAALHSDEPVDAVVALAGDIPPDLKHTISQGQDSKTDLQVRRGRWPRVLIGVGDREEWYTGPALDADLSFLTEQGIRHSVERFTGGHEWTDEFRSAIGRMLTSV